MRRSIFSNTLMASGCIAIMLILFSLPAVASAETLFYDGDGGKLQAAPDWAGVWSDLNLYPGTEEAPLASGNTVIIDYDPEEEDMTDPAWVAGGLSETGTAEGNSVEMRNGNVVVLVGGFSRYGAANGNVVILSGGSAGGVYGGVVGDIGEVGPLQAAVSLSASGNTVSIGNGVEIDGSVYGGYTEAIAFSEEGDASANAVASGNEVDIRGSTVEYEVYGGVAAAVADSAEDGAADAAAIASNNTANISGGTVEIVIGGIAEAYAGAEGGMANAAAMASGNEIDISGSDVEYRVYGGNARAGAEGGTANAIATASNNAVAIIGGSTVGWNVSGGTADAGADAYAEGGTASAAAMSLNNAVDIRDSGVDGYVYGGEAHAYVYGESDNAAATALADASGNIVKISGSTIGTYEEYNDDWYWGCIYGGYAVADPDIYGGGPVSAAATASDNEIDISGSTVYGAVNGGYARTYNEGTAGTSVIQAASANRNKVSVSGSEVRGYVAGGFAEVGAYGLAAGVSSAAATASNNTVDISGSTIGIYDEEYGYWYGEGIAGGGASAYAENATALASGNTVAVSGGTIGGSVYGGLTQAEAFSAEDTASADAIASNNTVDISGGTVGGVSGGEASANAYVYNEGDNAAATAEANASGNRVTVSGGTVGTNTNDLKLRYRRGGDLYGGIANADADSEEGGAASAAAASLNNAVAVVGGSTVDWGVYGGFADAEADAYYKGSAAAKAVVSENTVDISGSSVGGEVSGGGAYAYAYAYGESDNATATAEADASGNRVNISGSTIGTYNEEYGYWDGGYVYGGYARAYAGGDSPYVTVNASGNEIDVSGSAVYGDIYGGDADTSGYGYINNGNDAGTNVTQAASASRNTVNVSDSTIGTYDEEYGYWYGGNVYGGSARAETNSEASYNKVSITDSEVGENVYGGSASSVAYSEASYNTVNVSGGVIQGDIFGGDAYTWAYDDLTDATALASYNTVNVSGGEIQGDIFGGNAEAYADGGAATASATYNTVSLGGALNLAESMIYGGYGGAYGAESKPDLFTGNRLQVRSREIAVFGVENFEFYEFYLPEGTGASDMMLKVASSVNMDESYAQIFLQGATNLSAGDIITLIDSGGDVSKPLNDGEIVSARLGALVNNDFRVYVSDDDTNLYAAYEGGGPVPGHRAMGNGRLGAMAFLGQGADLSAGLQSFTTSGSVSGSNLTSFGGVLGGSSTYETGSDVEVNGWSLIAGVTWDAPVSRNSLRLSAFIEAGWGDYDTDNSYSGTSVKGNGDLDYFGGGLHARYSWLDAEKAGGWYADGSVRVGKINTDFNSWDLVDQFGRHLGYDSDSTYYGAHVGLGREWKLNEKTSIDVSSKFLWTRLEGDEFTTTTGDRVRIDDVDSYRWRTGFRVTNERTERFSIYGGLYYEYEFDGDAAGWLFGTYAMDKSSLGGGTGIGELGVMFRPSAENDRLTMGIGVQGYVGTREGVSGTLKLQYVF